MEVNENVINEYKNHIKALTQQLDIIDLTITDENKIDNTLISDDELETKLNELLYTFKRVYPNLDGDAKRMKLMGNIHYKDENNKVKSKSYQIYRLSKQEREGLVDWKDLQAKYKRIAKLCYYIEQIKLYENIKKIEEKIINIDEDDNFEQIELEKFFIKKERKRKSFF